MSDITAPVALNPEGVREVRQSMRRRPRQRLELIRALETDTVAAIEQLFELDEAQADHIDALRSTGVDRVLGGALSWALRRGADVEYRTERIPATKADQAEPTFRLELEAGPGKKARSVRITIIKNITVVKG